MTAGADWMDSARKLLDALRPPVEAAPTDTRSAGAPPAGPAGAPGQDTHEADCRWCPVCQAAAVLRGERPEVTAALADVLATTATVLRDLAGEPDPAGPPPADAAPEDAETPDGGPEPGPVQRIDIA
ncbi:hypothetical protein [Candidatus Blastococcus massiliensis]|uniref:hypothetical protein n=1 Tax=Candidatus Blastococcus massiliensis TaxID=1470358 RepID=UPI0004AEF8B4|nr:hypothetical protein [Candidatus Blastococcus massiliensis]